MKLPLDSSKYFDFETYIESLSSKELEEYIDNFSLLDPAIDFDYRVEVGSSVDLWTTILTKGKVTDKILKDLLASNAITIDAIYDMLNANPLEHVSESVLAEILAWGSDYVESRRPNDGITAGWYIAKDVSNKLLLDWVHLLDIKAFSDAGRLTPEMLEAYINTMSTMDSVKGFSSADSATLLALQKKARVFKVFALFGELNGLNSDTAQDRHAYKEPYITTEPSTKLSLDNILVFEKHLEAAGDESLLLKFYNVVAVKQYMPTNYWLSVVAKRPSILENLWSSAVTAILYKCQFTEDFLETHIKALYMNIVIASQVVSLDFVFKHKAEISCTDFFYLNPYIDKKIKLKYKLLMS